MPSSFSSARIGAIISLAGVALIMLGFLLPMFIESNPQIPGSAHPLYEWQVVIRTFEGPVWFALVGALAALPLLCMLIVLTTNVAMLLGVLLPRLVLLKRVAAAWGLVIQLFFDAFVFQIFIIGYGRVDIAWGFIVVLIGFMVVCVATVPFQHS
jgi:hypothetical protein